ncbi:hypothetical protein DACRYDRAFT_100012 [Dacryopinax primogenitus]|uniref:Uncharacterized protein n=1 Tax=Dacryopinax primogenitus (strain DJM 731) TaxID=1858805 RepID=M5G0Z7_DACPD|nr:uncharacterized protein DACRYDRAFT_100012 [Dacryopinax primogenitus]EJU02414.1 hypothetical protein DACRYDRAFT_100012 [Dacryopinax primogenitus]
MTHTLDTPSQSYTHSSASTLTRLANLLSNRSSADTHTTTSYRYTSGTRSAGHSRNQSEDSDWLGMVGYGTAGRRGNGLAVGGGRARDSGSSSDDREQEQDQAMIRARQERVRSSTLALGTGASSHPYATAAYTSRTPATPLRAPAVRVLPPTPHQLDRIQHQQQSQWQDTPPSRGGPSFYTLDEPGIGESPRPSPLKPNKSAAAVARFRAAAAKHDHTRYGEAKEEPVVAFYRTSATTPPPMLPTSTLSVITGSAAVEAAGLPPTPPLQGDYGTATIYPPMRVNGAPPLSPPQEPVRLSSSHPYASPGIGASRRLSPKEISPRRVRSSSMLIDNPTPPRSPQGTFPTQLYLSGHPYAPARQSVTTALATTLSVQPLRVPQQESSGHPFADPAFRRQRLDSNPSEPYPTWGTRNTAPPPPVPTHMRQQALRPSASASDLRSPMSPKDSTPLGLGFPSTAPGAIAPVSGGWHLFPRLGNPYTKLKPSTSTSASNPNPAGGTQTSARTDTSTSLQVRTACDALVFPRPRLRPHEISPPDSPKESPLFTPGEWARVQRQRLNLTETDPVPPQPRSAFLERVIAEGQQRERERTEWAAAAERNQIFTRQRAKSMPRPRDRPALSQSQYDLRLGRPSRGSDDSVLHWWNKVALGRNASTGSRVLRKTSSSSGLGRERPRTESLPVVVGLQARTTAAVGSGAMLGQGESLLRQRNAAVALNGHANGTHAPKLEARNPRIVRTSDDLPLVDIRPGAGQVPVAEKTPQAQPRPTVPRKEHPSHTAVHSSLPPSPVPEIGLAVSTPLIHPHIPHPYAAAFGSASASQLSSANTPGRGKNPFQPPPPSSLTAGPHPIESDKAHYLIEATVTADVARRHRTPPRAATQESPQVGAAPPTRRISRKPVPSYYAPALPPMLQEALESSDDGREFLASIDGDNADGEDEEEDHSRASTPRADDRRRGHHWDHGTERALLIAAGLNPSPSSETGPTFFSEATQTSTTDLLAAPSDPKVLRPAVSRTTLEDESGFVTASEGLYADSREELGQMSDVPVPAATEMPEIPSLPGSMVNLPGSFYMQSAAYRSVNTLASSVMLPLGMSPRLPNSPTSPPLPSPPLPHSPHYSPHSSNHPSTAGGLVSPGTNGRPFSLSRGSSGDPVPRPPTKSPRRTFSYGSRSSSELLDPPAPLGRLDQIEAQMFKDLYYTPAEDVDPEEFDEKMEAELSEARAMRELEKIEREWEREEYEQDSDVSMPPHIEVEEIEYSDMEIVQVQRLPKLSSPFPNGESESEQYLTPAGTGSRSRRPSSERAETPLSAYNESFGHSNDDIRVGQVGEMHIPEVTTLQMRHLSMPLSVVESEGTEVASTFNSSSPPVQHIISLAAVPETRLSIPWSPYTSDDGGRHSHLTAVSMGTSNTSGNDHFPQPPEDHMTPSSYTSPSSYMPSSYYTPIESVHEFPLELRMDVTFLSVDTIAT